MSAAVDVLQPVLRTMQLSDVVQICNLEKASYSFPWTERNFCDCLKFNYMCHVLEYGGTVAAYSICQVFPPEGHILNLCVDPEQRRYGFARLLLGFIQQQAVARQARHIYLEVRPSNLEAVALYLGENFVRVGCRPEYYPGLNGREDAILMRKWLGN
ncbi:MAG: ribosomal protein S18-alanine N-acetyltransferase [Candidatus Porifericomitaceae bacterium WSBS_2022_MAG_OTU9]